MNKQKSPDPQEILQTTVKNNWFDNSNNSFWILYKSKEAIINLDKNIMIKIKSLGSLITENSFQSIEKNFYIEITFFNQESSLHKEKRETLGFYNKHEEAKKAFENLYKKLANENIIEM